MRVLVLIFSLFCGIAFSQSPVASFNFDCNLSDQTGNYTDIDTDGGSICDCGINGDAMTTSGFVMDTTLTQLTQDDWGISFYFQDNSSATSVELITVGDNCSSDSTLRIYYLPTVNEVSVDLSQNVLRTTSLNGKVDPNKCWHHVVYTRFMNTYLLYLDGVLVDEKSENTFEVFLNFDDPMIVGDGPCVGLISTAFTGYIDELKIFDQNIQPFLVEALSIPNDEIINRDTTIFENGMITLEAVENCSGNISWSPSTGLESTNTFITKLTGIETTTYVATFTNVGCISHDSITVYVVNEDDISCDELLLPNIFTPNGDGLNDDIGILNHYIIEKLDYFEIYDRWGEKVFWTDDQLGKWDGTFKGKAVNSGDFLYKVAYTCQGGPNVKTGMITVMR